MVFLGGTLYGVYLPTMHTPYVAHGTPYFYVANIQSQIGTLFWVGFAHIPGILKDVNVSRLHITKAFHPTQPRNWLIPF